jgi:hypothetical protein
LKPRGKKKNSSARQSAAAAPAIAPRLLRRCAAADYLGLSGAYLDQLRAQGLVRPVPLPAARGAGAVRIPLFDIRDLDQLIDKLKAGGLT